MKYNFDEIINRENTDCEKYDERQKIFGTNEVIPLWVADTDFRTPDFIVDAVVMRAQHPVYGYPVIPESYYKSVSRWLYSRHNWEVGTRTIAFCPNVVIGLASVVLSMTQPGDKIIVQPPVYFPFFHVVEGNNRIMVENPLRVENGKYRFDFEDLKSKIDDSVKMLLLCNPHNPGGRVWSREELAELAEICSAYNIIIVSDEIHSDLIYPGYVHTPLATLSDEVARQTVTISSASKTFNMAGLSSAYLVIRNRELMSKLEKFMQATHISSGNFFGLVATEAAYTYGQDWLRQLMDYLELNCELVIEYFAQHFPSVKVMKPEGTFLVWVDVSPLGFDSQVANKKLIEAGVGITPGYLFGTGGNNYIRINVGCPRKVLMAALERFTVAFS